MTAVAEDGTLTINVTPTAAKKLTFFAQKQGIEDEFGVRVGVKGGGCSGLMYTLSIEKEPGENDKIVDNNNVKVFIDKKAYIFLAGTELDFSDGLNGKGFVFQNPNATKACGCGNSFSV